MEHFLRECRPVYEPGRIHDPLWRAYVAALVPERDPWLTPCEVAPLLHLISHGVRRRIAAGQLAARRWGGRYYLRRSALTTRSAPALPYPRRGTRGSSALPLVAADSLRHDESTL